MTAYGVVKLNANYFGHAMRVRRESDGAEQELGFQGQALDIGAANAFAGASRLRVVRLYAQDDSRLDISAAPSTAPWLYLGANGSPVILFRQNETMTMPSLPQVDRRAFSMWVAARFATQLRPTPVLDLGNQVDTHDLGVYQVFDAYVHQILTDAATKTSATSTRTLAASTPTVWGFVSSPSSLTFHRDAFTESAAALASKTLTQGGKLFGSHLPFVTARTDLMSLVVAAGASSAADALAVKQTLRMLHHTHAEALARQVFIQGDSLTEGVGADHNITLGRALGDLYNSSAVMVRSFGKSGDQMQYAYPTFWFQPAGTFLEPGAKNVLVTWLGTNDIAMGRTLEQLKHDIRNYVRGGGAGAAAANGWTRRVYATALPRTDFDAAKEATRLALNQWIRANGEGLFDAVWDADALTAAGGALQGFASDPTLAPDGLHPSERAYRLMAPSLKALVDSIAP